MIQTLILGLVTAAFCCWFAHSPEDYISGDWREWGFDSDPIEPEPTPTPEVELV